MTIPLLLAALALAGVGAWMKDRWPILARTLLAAGGAGLITVIVLDLRQNVFPPQPKAPNRCAMAVSYCLANRLLADMAGQTGSVLLLFPQLRFMDADAQQSYVDGFIPPLRHGHTKLGLRALRLGWTSKKDAGQELPAFKQALAQAPEAAAVVSYAGAPGGFETLFAPGQPNSPLFYIYDPNATTNWLGALKDGRIRAVVLPRPGADPRGQEAKPGRPEEVFDRFFVLATAANADQVVASLKNGD